MGKVGHALNGLLCALTLVVPVGVAGQAIVGDIVDDTRSPVVGASIGVFDAEGRLVAQGASDETGHFRISVPEPGQHRLHITRFSYRSLTGGPYELRRGLELEVFVVMHTAPLAVEGLDVEVDGRSGRLELAGFYEREDEGFGYHFDRDDLQRRGTIEVSDFLVRGIPGLRKIHGRTRLIGPASVRNDAIVFERGPQGCVPALWIDGVPLRLGGRDAEPLRPDDWFILSELEGIEFYGTASGAPAEFARSANCGVLVVWTRGAA